MAPPMQSLIWSYFTLDEQDRDKSQCKICNKKYSRKGRTTTSLKNHLKSMHPEYFSLFNSDNANRLQKKIDESGQFITSLQETKQNKKQVYIEVVDQKVTDKLIGEMIALQNLPFNFVEGIGFRRLIQEIAPSYNLRGPNFFTDFVCKELYGKVAEKVKILIEKFDYISFSTDIWTDPNLNVSLLSLTCHGISENFDRSSIVLKCEAFDDRHTGDIFAEKFDIMLTEWNISKEQVHCMIRDEGSNMKRSMRLAVFNDLDCTVHKIQLAVQCCLESQENIKEIKQKCLRISSHFNNSTTAQKQLQKVQDRLNKPHHIVFQDYVTRWNSTFYMFERFLKVKDALSIYIKDSCMDPILPEEWTIIVCCVELLNPFEEATRELSSSQTLISSAIPIIEMLMKKLDNHLTRSQDFDPIWLAITNLKTEMSANFFALEENSYFAISTYLDPRYKNKFFKLTTEETVKDEILKMKNIINVVSGSPNYETAKRMRMNDSLDETNEQPGSSGTVSKSCLRSDLAMMLDSSSENESEEEMSLNTSPGVVLKKELHSYRNKKRIHVSESPLNWWSVNRFELKMLSAIARRYMSPPPASVSSEQLFRDTESIYEPLQNRLEPEKAASVLFIKHNAPIFKFAY